MVNHPGFFYPCFFEIKKVKQMQSIYYNFRDSLAGLFLCFARGYDAWLGSFTVREKEKEKEKGK